MSVNYVDECARLQCVIGDRISELRAMRTKATQLQQENERLRLRENLHMKYRASCSIMLFGKDDRTDYSQMQDGIYALNKENERLAKALGAALEVKQIVFPAGSLVNSDCAEEAQVLRHMWAGIEQALQNKPTCVPGPV